MKVNWKNVKTKNLAGLICQHLKEDGIDVVLVGGSCVTIYSDNKYLSHDLDYVSHDEFWKIEASLKKIGFKRKERHFEHPECPFLIDFVTEPVSIGREIINEFETIETPYGEFKLLTPTDCVKDRLASFYYWDDRQGLRQAVDVCLDHRVNLKNVHEWSKKEGFENKFQIFKKELKESEKTQFKKGKP